MKKTTIIKSFIILIFCCSKIKAQDILIIYDDSPTNINTVSLKNALTTAGFNVILSSVSESNWNNTNPSLNGIETVIHLNGTTYATEMPITGQTALKDFVENNNGLYIGFEWNAYEVDTLNKMQNMVDLVLFKRSSSGDDSPRTLVVVPAQSNHPIMAGITTPFNVNGPLEIGGIRNFPSNPSTVIMKHNSYDVVAIRNFGTGHVLGFSLAPNWSINSTSLSNTNIQQIIINFINEYVDSALSIADNSFTQKIEIYPNPSSEYIQISGLSLEENYRIYNILGSKVKNGIIHDNEQIDIRDLNKGIYLLEFDNGSRVKFIKE